MTIIAMRAKRAKAIEAAKAFLESHRDANGFLSTEDDAIYTGMENDIGKMGVEIARMERMICAYALPQSRRCVIIVSRKLNEVISGFGSSWSR